MCGPFFHGWYTAETDEILADRDKNAHGEFELPHAVIGAGRRTARYGELPHGQYPPGTLHSIYPIPYGIIPATGEVVVQQSGLGAASAPGRYWQNTATSTSSVSPQALMAAMRKLYAPGIQPSLECVEVDLSARAKRRIAATWDIEIPTVAQLILWIRAHYARRGDGEEWAVQMPKTLCREAQKHFFPVWLFEKHNKPQGTGAYDDAIVLAEAPDSRRICEALRRGGANDYWQQAGKEDRAAKAELVLAEN